MCKSDRDFEIANIITIAIEKRIRINQDLIFNAQSPAIVMTAFTLVRSI